MKRLTQIFQALLGVVALICMAVIAMGRFIWRTIRNWWKSSSKWIRYSMATAFLLIVVGFFGIVACVIYEKGYGRDYYDKKLSDNIYLHSFADNNWRVYNRETREYTTDKISWVSDVSKNDSLVVYALPGKRGYINVNTGGVVVDAEANNYSKAWVFSEGVAAVVKEGKIGFINAKNEVVIPFQFDYTNCCSMPKVGYVFHYGYCTMTNANGKLGIIDRNGKWVIEPIYDEIWAPHKSGYRVVAKEGKFGVLDTLCRVVYPMEYNSVEILSDGFVFNKEGRKWQVDFEGNIIQSFMYDRSFILSYPVGYDEEGNRKCLFSDYVKYEVEGCYGIMNRITGKLITLAIYSDIIMLSANLFEVQDAESYDYYPIDLNEKVVSKR